MCGSSFCCRPILYVILLGGTCQYLTKIKNNALPALTGTRRNDWFDCHSLLSASFDNEFDGKQVSDAIRFYNAKLNHRNEFAQQSIWADRKSRLLSLNTASHLQLSSKVIYSDGYGVHQHT